MPSLQNLGDVLAVIGYVFSLWFILRVFWWKWYVEKHYWHKRPEVTKVLPKFSILPAWKKKRKAFLIAFKILSMCVFL